MRNIVKSLFAAAIATAGVAPALAAPETEAVALLKHYYGAINAHHYRTAFSDWSHADSGVIPTGQTYAQFKRGFRDTATVRVVVGQPGNMEGAAGSTFVEVPVTVSAHSTKGTLLVFAGTYTLRKSNLSVADGVSPADQHWHLYAAHLHKVH